MEPGVQDIRGDRATRRSKPSPCAAEPSEAQSRRRCRSRSRDQGKGGKAVGSRTDDAQSVLLEEDAFRVFEITCVAAVGLRRSATCAVCGPIAGPSRFKAPLPCSRSRGCAPSTGLTEPRAVIFEAAAGTDLLNSVNFSSSWRTRCSLESQCEERDHMKIDSIAVTDETAHPNCDGSECISGATLGSPGVSRETCKPSRSASFSAANVGPKSA